MTAAHEVAESRLPRELLWGNLQSETIAVNSVRATLISHPSLNDVANSAFSSQVYFEVKYARRVLLGVRGQSQEDTESEQEFTVFYCN